MKTESFERDLYLSLVALGLGVIAVIAVVLTIIQTAMVANTITP